MRFAALTMVHDEAVFLKIWLSYYTAQVGRENLYVIRHGYAKSVEHLLEGINTIYLPRHNIDWQFDKLRFSLINAYAQNLLNNYDGVIAGDVDEVVFVDPNLNQSLSEFMVRHRDHPVLNVLGFHIVSEDSELISGQPLFAQRNSAFVDHLYCKPLVAFEDPVWSKGYHASIHSPFVPSGLYMAHLRCMSRAINQEIAVSRKESVKGSLNIGQSKSRQNWWLNYDNSCLALRNAARRHPGVAFDNCVDEIRAELTANVVKNSGGRSGLSMLLPVQNLRDKLLLPDRFKAVPILT
jgi:hypothetical protein